MEYETKQNTKLILTMTENEARCLENMIRANLMIFTEQTGDKTRRFAEEILHAVYASFTK